MNGGIHTNTDRETQTKPDKNTDDDGAQRDGVDEVGPWLATAAVGRQLLLQTWRITLQQKLESGLKPTHRALCSFT